jgi:hypothetical protein
LNKIPEFVSEKFALSNFLHLVLTKAGQLFEWANENQGTVTIILFFATVFLGWISGIFTALRKRPKFQISTIPGPTFSCTYPTGNTHNDMPCHRTGIAVYLKILNVGYAPSDIVNVSLAFHWTVRGNPLLFLRKRVGWHWLYGQATSVSDFQVSVKDKVKIYPFLTQRSSLSGQNASSYLKIGEGTNGVAYFEQPEAYGACFPLSKNGRTKVKICVEDAFGKKHTRKFWIPVKSLDEAQRYNPDFGKSFDYFGGAEGIIVKQS